MGLHPIVRPLGLILAFLGNIQGLTWGILSLISILQYSDVLNECPKEAGSYTELLGGYMCIVFMKKEDVKRNAFVNASSFFIFSIVCLLLSIIWISASCFLIWGLHQNKWAAVHKLLIGWMAVTAVVTLEDLVVTILLAIDIAKITSLFNTAMESTVKPPATAYVQIFSMHILMAIVAKGYMLLMVNVAIIIYVIQFLNNGELKESPMFDKESKSIFVREDRSTRVSVGDQNVGVQYSNAAYLPDDELFNRRDDPGFKNSRDEIEVIGEHELYNNANWSKNTSLSTNSLRANSFARVGRASKTPILGQKIQPPRVPSPDYNVSTVRTRPGIKY